ncbi:hypothetical protein [Ostreiculturibacter nitratireducens]|uniref:hypothetical protein n=1 Tax=Ostreiculturibacter nitratireducens TaxID=3075226 RepID=UPI0031B57577
MAGFTDIHTKLVFWLKILLPLGALAILSTLFLLSRSIDPEDAIPYAEVDVEELAREQRLSAPEYAGVTTDGAAVTVTAAAARPDAQDSRRVSATGIHAVMDTANSLKAVLSAAEGVIDTGASMLTLSGSVDISTSTGYHVAAPHVTSALDRTEVIADGPLAAEAPYGKLEAGSMELRADPEAEGGNVLIFKDGVKLVYEPETEEAP